MNTDTQVAPDTTQNPAETHTETIPEVVTPEAPDAAPNEGESKPEKTAEQKELEYLRRKATKADRTSARLYQEAQALRAQVARPVEGDSRDPVEIAREIATIERTRDKSNDVANAGFKKYGEEAFKRSLQTVIDEAGPLISERGHLTPLGEAILDAENAAALIKYLGSDPALADELDGLSATQLGRRIERIEAQMQATPKTSSAPKPLTATRGAASSGNNLSDDLSIDEWVKRRNKEVRAR